MQNYASDRDEPEAELHTPNGEVPHQSQVFVFGDELPAMDEDDATSDWPDYEAVCEPELDEKDKASKVIDMQEARGYVRGRRLKKIDWPLPDWVVKQPAKASELLKTPRKRRASCDTWNEEDTAKWRAIQRRYENCMNEAYALTLRERINEEAARADEETTTCSLHARNDEEQAAQTGRVCDCLMTDYEKATRGGEEDDEEEKEEKEWPFDDQKRRRQYDCRREATSDDLICYEDVSSDSDDDDDVLIVSQKRMPITIAVDRDEDDDDETEEDEGVSTRWDDDEEAEELVGYARKKLEDARTSVTISGRTMRAAEQAVANQKKAMDAVSSLYWTTAQHEQRCARLTELENRLAVRAAQYDEAKERLITLEVCAGL